MAKQANKVSAEVSADKIIGKVIVTKQFEDSRNHYHRYDEGQDVTDTFSVERVAELVKHGVVEVVDEPEQGQTTEETN